MQIEGPYFSPTLRADIALLVAVAGLSALTGMGFNLIRKEPLPLGYKTAAERLMSSRLIAGSSIMPRFLNNSGEGYPIVITSLNGINSLYDPMKYSRFNKANSTATEPGRTADLVEFGRAVADGKTLIVDARPGLFFREAHVPGAISLPRDDFDAIYARSAAWLESRRDTPVIVYCSDRSCEDAVLVARALASLGYSDVRVFSGGWAEWNTRAIFPDNTAHGR